MPLLDEHGHISMLQSLLASSSASSSSSSLHDQSKPVIRQRSKTQPQIELIRIHEQQGLLGTNAVSSSAASSVTSAADTSIHQLPHHSKSKSQHAFQHQHQQHHPSVAPVPPTTPKKLAPASATRTVTPLPRGSPAASNAIKDESASRTVDRC